jgi:integration host factor subunit beta
MAAVDAAASVKPASRVTRNQMNRHDIADKLPVRHPDIACRDSETQVSAMFDIIMRGFPDRQRIELRGFDSFGVKLRRGRNPKTGAPVMVVAKRIPGFRADKELRVEVNGPALGESESPA